jgi:hypothetical protein
MFIMAYCHECGQEVAEDAVACPNCGAALGRGQPHGQQQGQQQPGYQQPQQSQQQPGYQQPQPGQQHAPPQQQAQQQSGLVSSGGPIGRKLALGGGLLAAIAAFLPWFSLNVAGTSASISGIERDGVFTLIMALVVLGVGAWRWGKWQRGLSFVLGGFILVFGGLYIYDPFFGSRGQMTAVQQQVEQAVVSGPGLYLTAIGGLLILLGIIYDTWFETDWKWQQG